MTSIATKSSRFEESPTLTAASSVQWKLTLQEIKLLYIQRQYKRCVARSSSILSTAREPIHPVYKTYLYFYSAISYEAMGRCAHTYSINKLPLLHSGLDSFVTCLAVLPSPLLGTEDTRVAADDPRWESDPQSARYNNSGADSSLGQSSFGLEPFPTSELSKAARSLSPSPFLSPSSSPSPSISTLTSTSTSPTESIVSSITDIIDKTLLSPEDDPFLSDYDCEGHNDAEADMDIENASNSPYLLPYNNHGESKNKRGDEKEKNLIPSPLQVRKSSKPLALALLNSSTSSSENPEDQIQSQVRSRPPPLPFPIKVIITSSKVKVKAASTKPASSNRITPSPPHLPRANPHSGHSSYINAYNASIHFLHTQITTSISSIHTLINEVTELRALRAASRMSFQRSASFWSFSPVKEGSGPDMNTTTSDPASRNGRETIQERIVRLRAEGWETVGLKCKRRGWKGAEYYREFCGRALDELYLDP